MHHVRQGNQWYFGIKAHIGADAVAGLAKSLAVTGANVAGVRQVPRLLDGGVGRCGGGGVAKAGDTEPVRNIVRRQRRKLGADADYPTYLFNELRIRYRMAKRETQGTELPVTL